MNNYHQFPIRGYFVLHVFKISSHFPKWSIHIKGEQAKSDVPVCGLQKVPQYPGVGTIFSYWFLNDRNDIHYVLFQRHSQRPQLQRKHLQVNSTSQQHQHHQMSAKVMFCNVTILTGRSPIAQLLPSHYNKISSNRLALFSTEL